MSNSSIWPIDRTLSSATTPSWSELMSNENEEVLRVLQCSSVTGASPLDCLVSYPVYSLGNSLTPLQRCCLCILLPPPTRLEYKETETVNKLILVNDDIYLQKDISVTVTVIGNRHKFKTWKGLLVLPFETFRKVWIPRFPNRLWVNNWKKLSSLVYVRQPQ